MQGPGLAVIMRAVLAVAALAALATPADAQRKRKPAPAGKAPARPAPPAPAAPEPPAAPVPHADQLYAEAQALLASDPVAACAKFEQSLRENPAALGTLLNVALCDEKLGRVASAHARFAEARDRAEEEHLAVQQRAAEEHLAALAPLVPHVAIALTEPLPELTVVIDDRVIAPAQLADVAVDPGERVIVVSAPHRLPYRTTISIAPRARARVVVPALASSITVTSSRRRIGQILTASGVAAIATGAGLGLYARHLFHAQFPDHCTTTDGHDHCDAVGLRNTDRAASFGNVGTVVGIAGVAIAGVGVYLWLRAPASSRPAAEPGVAIVPALGAEHVGVTALGHF